MNDSSKAQNGREFWVDYNLNPINSLAKPVMNEKPNAIMESYYTHVIEYSAYQQLEKELQDASRIIKAKNEASELRRKLFPELHEADEKLEAAAKELEIVKRQLELAKDLYFNSPLLSRTDYDAKIKKALEVNHGKSKE